MSHNNRQEGAKGHEIGSTVGLVALGVVAVGAVGVRVMPFQAMGLLEQATHLGQEPAVKQIDDAANGIADKVAFTVAGKSVTATMPTDRANK